MKALDTNVLARYLLRDDVRQAETARRYIAAAVGIGERLLLPTPVLCELVWVLEDCYAYGRKEQAEVIDKVLRVAEFSFEDKDMLWQALADFTHGKADFADYVIGRIARRNGCSETATFDRALDGEAGYLVLR